MKELEEYKKTVDEAIAKAVEAHDKVNEVYAKNREYEETVLRPHNGNLTPTEKQREQELLDELRDAITADGESIDTLKKL